MTESTYRSGYQSGWFYDEEESKDIDYIQGVEDGKRDRIKIEEKRRKRSFANKVGEK